MIALDLDWNPAICAQAAARCWRPGQTRPCAVVRLHAAGTIDERLLQRLHHKSGLCVALEGGGGGGASKAGGGAASRRSNAPAFTPAELRALFTLDAGVATCGTRGLLVGKSGGGGGGAEADPTWAVDAREAVDEADGAAVAAAPLLAAAAAAAEVTWVHRQPLAGEEVVPEEDAAAEAEEEGDASAEAPCDGAPTAAAEPASADGVEALELDA